jgi:hypothetical protein
MAHMPKKKFKYFRNLKNTIIFNIKKCTKFYLYLNKYYEQTYYKPQIKYSTAKFKISTLHY